MRLILNSVVAVFVMACGSPALADDKIPANPRYVFQPMGDNAGLSTRTVSTMIQDRQGFIWIGTHNGLFRFDGVQVATMYRSPGNKWTYISQLIKSNDGKIWVSSDGAVAHFDGVNFIPLRLPLEEDRSVRTLDVPQRLAFDANDNLYMATTRGIIRLAAADRNQWRQWSKKEGLPADNVVAVHMAPNGVLWFAAGDRVGTLDPKTDAVKIHDLFGALPPEKIIAVLASKSGVVWVRTQTHLFRRARGDKAFSLAHKSIAEALGVGMPALDSKGQIWVPSRVGVFFQDPRGSWVRLSAKSGLRTSAVATVLEDREGELWFGLDGSGLSRWPGRRSWAAWTTDNGLPDNGVWDTLRDSRGRLWVATNNGLGIWQPATKSWRILRNADGIVGHGVWKTFEGPDKQFWSISRRVGLNRYDPDSLTPRPVSLPAACKSGPTDLAPDPRRGLFWMAGNDYVYKVTGDKDRVRFELVKLPPSLAGCTEVIAVAPGGVVWAGGRNGLGRYDGSRWRHFTTKDGLVRNYVQYLSPVSGDDVWLDYRSPVGLSRLKLGAAGPKVTHLTREQGLLSDTVWMLEQDTKKQLWVGHSSGLSVVTPAGEILHLTRHDGLIWNDIAQAGFLSLPDGSVFIGTSRGLAYHRPGSEGQQSKPPTMVITSAMLSGKELLGQAKPRVPYDENTLSVKYSGVTYRNPHATSFRYRLAGLETEHVITKLREVRYSALPAGSFTFEVSCRSARGLWSKQASFSFSVAPPWWERLDVRLAGAFAVMLLLALILKARTYKLAADRKRLEIAVKERSAQLAEANDQLEVANYRLRELSFTDGLTQVHNRHFFSSVIDTEVYSAHRRGDPRTAEPGRNRDLVFFMVDLDHFKAVNDTWGHSAGDRVLVETARRLQESIRQSDLLVRWGGEEFLILCRETEQGEASVVAGRILAVMQEAPFWVDGSHSTRRTCSVGWAALPTANPKLREVITHKVAIELADKALYMAKEAGRNRAVGVEIVADAVQQEKDLTWLERPLSSLDGTLVHLSQVEGAGLGMSEAAEPKEPPGEKDEA